MAAIPLAKAVGARLRAIRSDNGIPLDRIAAEARQLGLRWAKSSVAALETGRHVLDLGELLLLPMILARAGAWANDYQAVNNPDGTKEQIAVGRHPVGLADLIPDDDHPVLLAGTVQTSARALRDIFARVREARLEVEGLEGSVGEETAAQVDHLPQIWCQKMFESIREHRRRLTPPDAQWHPDEDEEFWPSIGRDAADDATRKAAAVLKVPTIAVSLAARAQWNGVWGLTGEREHRLAVRLPGLARDAVPDRRLQARRQALRGHITRELLEELRPLLKEITKKRRTRR
jgi:hypothetical protein